MTREEKRQIILDYCEKNKYFITHNAINVILVNLYKQN